MNLEAAYNVSKKDTLYLYNAALVATEAKDYDIALGFYEKLIELGYSGISMNYYAVEKESGKEQVFQDEKSRNFSVDVISSLLPIFLSFNRAPSNIIPIIRTIPVYHIYSA